MAKEEKTEKGVVRSREADRLKELGFVQNRGTDRFNCRVITRSGRMSTSEVKEILYLAEEYGEKEVIISGDGNLEIKGIAYENIDKVLEYCKKHRISIGGTGAKVRPITTCMGKECVYGILDAYELAEKLRELFYVRLHNVTLPNKLEIAVSGCPTNCTDVDLYDIGIMGIRIPQCEMVNCMGCKTCAIEKKCPNAAAGVVNEKLRIDSKKCTKCGLCVGACPFGTITKGTVAYRIYVGGSKGQKKRKGHSLEQLFTAEESVLSVVDRLIGLYQEEGRDKETFYEMLDRIGLKNVERKVFTQKESLI